MTSGSIVGRVTLAALGVALSACSGRLAVSPGPEPTGSLMSIDRAALADDGRTLRLTYVGWKPYTEDDPCSARYEAWADVQEGRLVAAIHETLPPRTMDCNLLGYTETLSVPLVDRYTGVEVVDRSGGSLLLRAPDTLARFEGLPEGWELREQELLRSDQESGRHAHVDRVWSAEPLPQEYQSWGRLELVHAFGGPSLIRGEGRLEPITIGGAPAMADVDGWYGELIVTWTLDGDGFALIANEADFDLPTLIRMAETVHLPPV